MYNPLDTIRRFQSRIGKPIRPIIELQKDGSIINIITTSVQTEQMVSDVYRVTGWEVQPGQKTSALYIDGLYKGQSFFAGEEGAILNISKEVKDEKGNTVVFSYSGLFGKLLDASLIERGSALKASFMEKAIWAFMGLLMGAMMGFTYGAK